MKKPIESDLIVGGLLLHYYRVQTEGEKRGTILLLHGWGSNSTLWFTSTLSLAEKGYELIFLDLPGFGKSQSPKKAFYLEDYARIVAQFVEKIDGTKPTLIGHSFGGKIAIRIASKKMIQMNGLILVDSSGLAHTSLITQAKIRVAQTMSPLFRLPLLKDLKSGLLRLSGSDDYVAFPELKETFVNIIQEHVADELSNISTQTLVVWGEKDTNSYTPLSDASVFQKAIPHAQLKTIQEAGHYVFLDQPAEFKQIISAFIESIHAHH